MNEAGVTTLLTPACEQLAEYNQAMGPPCVISRKQWDPNGSVHVDWRNTNIHTTEPKSIGKRIHERKTPQYYQVINL